MKGIISYYWGGFMIPLEPISKRSLDETALAAPSAW
jgi:hypothetical protein